MKYELVRFKSMKITYIFFPICVGVTLLYSFLYLLLTNDDYYSVSILEDYKTVLIGVMLFGFSFLIPYCIGSWTQEFKNNSIKLTTLAFPKRIFLFMGKYIFTLVTTLMLFIFTASLSLFLLLLFSLGKDYGSSGFSSLFSTEAFWFTFTYIIFIACCITSFFAITALAKSAIPGIVFFFGWISVGQWVFLGILSVIINDEEITAFLSSFVPFTGNFLSLTDSFYSQHYQRNMIISTIVTVLFTVFILVGSMVAFEKRDV